MSTLPACSDPFEGAVPRVLYDVMYKYTMVDGQLTNPVPFFALEVQMVPGHLGGGIVSLPGGDILYGTGDFLPYGMDGSYAPQFDSEHTGKLLRIDPRVPKEYKVVAKGVRNPQQLRCFEQGDEAGRRRKLNNEKSRKKAPKTGENKEKIWKKAPKSGKKTAAPKSPPTDMIIAFMDIGGVTAEEVNAFPVSMLDSDEIMNFGWGRSFEDGYAREGTFYINHGIPLVQGTEPSCRESAPVPEPGFCQPWVQFGRTPTDSYFGISSFQIPSEGMLEVVFSEFNTGTIFGSPTAFNAGAPPTEEIEKLKMFKGGLEYDTANDLVAEELGPNVSFTSRGDPRLFHFPNGDLGLLIERTGTFYKVQEIMLQAP